MPESHQRGFSATDCQLLFYGEKSDILQLSVYEPDVAAHALPESLIQNLWARQQFATRQFRSVRGREIRVYKPGALNADTGPDFRNAMLELGGTTWHGDIEIHRTSHDWYVHKHHQNPRYNSTVLHVTLFADSSTGALHRADGSVLPELVLGPYLDKPLRQLLHAHRNTTSRTLPCKDLQPTYAGPALASWLDELARARLRRKKQRIETTFLHTPDLETLLYQLTLAGLGYAKNISPMLQLAQRLPLSICRTIHDPDTRAGIFLAAAGLINSKHNRHIPTDEEKTRQLTKLLAQLEIIPMPASAWQFFRLRPNNFPTLRLLQAATLFDPDNLFYRDAIGLLHTIMHRYPPNQWIRVLHKALKPLPKPAGSIKSRGIGKSRITKLMMNAICPVMLVYAEQVPNPALEQQIYAFTQYLKFEHDQVTRFFSGLALPDTHAGISQGLHELHETYCQRGKCTTCTLGKSFIYKDL